ncbi:hypothetical protein BH11ARM2_BH11ARM2_12920 [soil metagenome]
MPTVETEPWTYVPRTTWRQYLVRCYTCSMGYGSAIIAAILLNEGLREKSINDRTLCFTLAFLAACVPLAYAHYHWQRLGKKHGGSFIFRFDEDGVVYETDKGIRVRYPYVQIASFEVLEEWLKIQPREPNRPFSFPIEIFKSREDLAQAVRRLATGIAEA